MSDRDLDDMLGIVRDPEPESAPAVVDHNGAAEAGEEPSWDELEWYGAQTPVAGEPDAEQATRTGGSEATPIVFATLRDFLEINFPPAESLVGHVRGGTNLLPRFGWVMPWGREGSTKTTTIVDLLFHAAAGRDWLHYPIPRALRFVAIMNEGVPGGFQDKLQEKLDLWEGDDGDADSLLDNLALYASPWGEFTFRDERMVAHLRDFARDFEADYVAGDPLHTLGTTGSGLPEETEAFKHQLRAFGVWEWIGALTAHHSNKAGMVSGDWGRHPDTLFHLEKDGKHPRTKLTLQKARPADPGEINVPQLLEWIVETKSYRVVATDSESVGDANCELVLDAIREGLRSAADVGERTELSARTVKRHFRDLEKAGLVRLEEGPNRVILAALRDEEEGEIDEEPVLQGELAWN